jgi:hypothetical protein
LLDWQHDDSLDDLCRSEIVLDEFIVRKRDLLLQAEINQFG